MIESSYSDFEGTRIHQLHDLLLSIADINLTVDFSERAFVVSGDGESLIAVAVEGINNSVAIDGNICKIIVIIDQVHGGSKDTALWVLFNSNSKVESPATFRNLRCIFKTEIANLNGTWVVGGCIETSSSSSSFAQHERQSR